METDEAIDLIYSLPQGTHYIASKNNVLSWTDWKHALADIQDDIRMSRGLPRVIRPADIEANRRARKKSHETRKQINETKWEAC